MSAHSTKWGSDDKTKMEANDLFIQLKGLMDTKLSLYWHFTYLERYISDGIIPFGLRLKLFPHFPNPSNYFKNKWENALSNCSLTLMQLLIDQHKIDLDHVDSEILICNTKIKALKLGEILAEREREISMGMETLCRDLISKKEKKLARDRKAFLANSAYSWPPVPQNRYFRKLPPRSDTRKDFESSETSISSASSMNSQSSSRQIEQATKRLKGAEHDNQYTKRRGNWGHQNELSGEGAATTTSAPATSSNVPSPSNASSSNANGDF